MTDDIATFIRARLDEDERVARAACWDDQSAEWTARPPQASYERYTVVDYLDDGVVAVTPENADDDGVGQHIARHDPARVLAEVSAKRRITDEHQPELGDCRVCAGPEDFAEDADGDRVWSRSAVYAPCPTLRLLAVPYREHPDYRPEWAPGA